MLSRSIATISAVFAMASLPVLAAAAGDLPVPIQAPIKPGECDTGPIQCCQTVSNAGSPAAQDVLGGLLNVVVKDLSVVVGLNCDPITVIGVVVPDTCKASPVCCDDNSHGGLISIGCVPVQL